MQSVCFTDECEEMTRAELTEMASKKFDVRKSVTKDLDILVCQYPGFKNSKIEKAKQYGIRIITYNEFLEMIGYLKVTEDFSIMNGVLKECHDKKIENADIGDGVKEISAFVFDRCKKLASLSLPESLEEIRTGAFMNCNELSHIEFRGTVEQWEKVTGKELNLLQYVPATSVKCSDGEWQKPLVFVSDGVAVKCLDKSTTSIKLDEGVTAISENAFKECASVLTIELPSTLTEIRKGAFDDCKNVEKIVSHSPLFPFNEKTKKLYDATGKTKKVVLSILAGKEKAKKEKIAQVQNMSASAVLESIMSEHKTNAQVVRDDKNAFLRIKTEDGGFEIVLADSKVSKWMPNLPAFLDFVTTGADSVALRKFAIENGLEDASRKYITVSNVVVSWKKKTNPVYLFIPEGITIIERNAFYRCESLERVVLFDGMEEIDMYAFEYCESLKSVVIPPSLKKIDGFAFYCCHSLEDLTIPNGVEIIEDSAFASCRYLESLTIPGSVQNIGYGAFSGCTGLKTLVIEKGVGKIESLAFHDCTSLSEIKYTGTVAEWEKIEKGRRWNCEAPAQFVKCSDGEVSIVPKIEEIKTDTYTLKIYDNGIEKCTRPAETDELIIPDGITVIEHSAFWECTGIKSVVFPSSLTKIELDAFSNCTALESIEIPDGMKIIDPSAFDGCTSLKSVVLPASLTRIGYKVFRYCSSLNEIIYKGTIEQWKAVNNEFYGNEDMPAKVVHCADGDVEI